MNDESARESAAGCDGCLADADWPYFVAVSLYFRAACATDSAGKAVAQNQLIVGGIDYRVNGIRCYVAGFYVY